MTVKREPKRIDAAMTPMHPQIQTVASFEPGLRTVLQAVQGLNRALIAENDALKAENIQHHLLTKTQDEYIKTLEKMGRAHEEALQKFGQKIASNFIASAETMVIETIPKVLKSQATSTAKRARQARTDTGSALVKNKALALYDARNWDSIVAAAKAIFPEVQKFANALARRQSLSEARFPVTLGGWIRNRQIANA